MESEEFRTPVDSIACATRSAIISRIALAVALLILGTAETSVSQILPFKTYSTKEGLLSNDVGAISQDSRGRMWFGTTEGISVFDGRTYTNYTTANGLPRNFIYEIFPDRNVPNTMWILADGWLCKFADGRLKAETLDVAFVRTIYQDSRGLLWCGTNRGAVVLDGKTVRRFHPGPLDTAIVGIAEIGDSVLWFGIDRGLVRYSRKTQECMKIDLHRYGDGIVWSMIGDRHGNLWVEVGNNYIVQVRGREILHARKFHQRADWLAEDTEGFLWFGGYEGIGKIPIDQFGTALPVSYTVENGLGENTIRSLYFDRERNLWVGGRDKGIVKLSTTTTYQFPMGYVWYWYQHRIATSDSSNHLWAISDGDLKEVWKDNSGEWHSHRHGLYSGHPQAVPHHGDDGAIGSLFYDSQGKLWISNSSLQWFKCYEIIPNSSSQLHSNLALLNTVTPRLTIYPVLCFIVARNGDLWVCGEGIVHLDPKRSNPVVRLYGAADGVDTNYTRALYEDSRGNIWAGGFHGGLAKLPANEIPMGTFHRYSTGDGLSGSGIWSIQENRAGQIVIGTAGGGISIVEGDSIRTLTAMDGLPTNTINSTAQDAAGRLWMASGIGMLREDPPGSLRFLRSQVFVGAAAQCCGTTQNGLVWFMTSHDLFVHDYALDTRDTISPPVYITGFKVNGNRQTMAGEIRLPYDQNNCEVEFIGISFKDEAALRYTYRLANVDNDWLEPMSNTSIIYGHLDPGRYHFEVKAINIDGVESAAPATIAITILPPFWRTWWFYGAVSISMIFAAGTTYRIRAKRMAKEQQISQAFSLQLIESQEAERKRVAGELHDGLGQELMVIMNRAQLGLRGTVLEAIKTQLNEISQTASRAVENVRTIAYNLSPYHLDQLGLVESIKSMAQRLEGLADVCVTLDISALDRVNEKMMAIHLYRIVQECLSNIVKHSAALEASITAEQRGHSLVLIIRDNGRGFRDSSKPAGRNGFGLVGISERVKMLHGTLDIASSPGNGTSLKITIPFSDSVKQSSTAG